MNNKIALYSIQSIRDEIMLTLLSDYQRQVLSGKLQEKIDMRIKRLDFVLKHAPISPSDHIARQSYNQIIQMQKTSIEVDYINNLRNPIQLFALTDQQMETVRNQDWNIKLLTEYTQLNKALYKFIPLAQKPNGTIQNKQTSDIYNCYRISNVQNYTIIAPQHQDLNLVTYCKKRLNQTLSDNLSERNKHYRYAMTSSWLDMISYDFQCIISGGIGFKLALLNAYKNESFCAEVRELFKDNDVDIKIIALNKTLDQIQPQIDKYIQQIMGTANNVDTIQFHSGNILYEAKPRTYSSYIHRLIDQDRQLVVNQQYKRDYTLKGYSGLHISQNDVIYKGQIVLSIVRVFVHYDIYVAGDVVFDGKLELLDFVFVFDKKVSHSSCKQQQVLTNCINKLAKRQSFQYVNRTFYKQQFTEQILNQYSAQAHSKYHQKPAVSHLIGLGKQGCVYQSLEEQDVIIKVVPHKNHRSIEYQKRMKLLEAGACSNLIYAQHIDNIDGLNFIQQPKMKGSIQELSPALLRSKQFIFQLIKQVFAGILVLHNVVGRFHFDMKLDNVMYTTKQAEHISYRYEFCDFTYETDFDDMGYQFKIIDFDICKKAGIYPKFLNENSKSNLYDYCYFLHNLQDLLRTKNIDHSDIFSKITDGKGIPKYISGKKSGFIGDMFINFNVLCT